MANWKWKLGLTALFLGLAFFLLQFMLATERIREWASAAERPGPNDAPRVVLISQELDNPYWRAVETGAREAAERYGWLLEYTGPRRLNPDEQARLLDKAIAGRPDALLVQGVGEAAFREGVARATRAGIPVVTIDTDEPGSGRIAYVGTDNVRFGRAMGERVAQASGGRGRIGVLIGDARAPNQLQRLAGFREAIAAYPELSIVDVRESRISRLYAAAEAERMLKAHAPVDVLVGFSSLDGPGMLEGAARVGAAPRIFATDDVPETIEAIRGCRIALTLVQQPEEMGRAAVRLLNELRSGRDIPEYIYTEAKAVSAAEADASAGAVGSGEAESGAAESGSGVGEVGSGGGCR